MEETSFQPGYLIGWYITSVLLTSFFIWLVNNPLNAPLGTTPAENTAIIFLGSPAVLVVIGFISIFIETAKYTLGKFESVKHDPLYWCIYPGVIGLGILLFIILMPIIMLVGGFLRG